MRRARVRPSCAAGGCAAGGGARAGVGASAAGAVPGSAASGGGDRRRRFERGSGRAASTRGSSGAPPTPRRAACRYQPVAIRTATIAEREQAEHRGAHARLRHLVDGVQTPPSRSRAAPWSPMSAAASVPAAPVPLPVAWPVLLPAASVEHGRRRAHRRRHVDVGVVEARAPARPRARRRQASVRRPIVRSAASSNARASSIMPPKRCSGCLASARSSTACSGPASQSGGRNSEIGGGSSWTT